MQMMTHRTRFLLLATLATAQLNGNTCTPSAPSQSWSYTPSSGALRSGSRGECLTASPYPPGDGTSLVMGPCDGSPPQAFDFVPGAAHLIVSRGAPTKCVNLAGYGTSAGTTVWLYGCEPAPTYECNGNCDWESDGSPGHLRNNASQLCLDDGYEPPMPATCDPTSPSASLPFCDPSLSFAARAADLTARLSLPYKLSLFALPLPSVPFPALVNETLALAAFYWDVTMIHGLSTTFFLNPLHDATCFPHAIAQGASWDVDLVSRIATAVAFEARIVHHKNFVASNGRAVQALHAEGGPLANSVHSPLWGRAQETYGEDPHLISVMGVAFTRALQNASATGGGSGDAWLQVASMSRHFLGFHGATDLPSAGEEWVTPQWLADQHLPAYRALMVDGQAEAIMCSCNTLRVGDGDGAAGGIPACVHPLLYSILRQDWNSSALVQADNEAIFPMFQEHHYYATLQEAVVGALNAGVVAVDSGGGAQIVAALGAALGNGTISLAQIDAMVQRQMLLRLRVGEFDTANPRFPFADAAYDAAQLNGATHRALAREAVTKSVTLLVNRNRTLPLDARVPHAIAVVGPWANSSDNVGGYGCNNGYLGNYAATTSVVSTVIDAVMEEVAGNAATRVAFAPGTLPYTPISPKGIADAAALAGASDVTLLVLGLGCGYETESIDRPDLYLPPIQDELLAAVSLAVQARRAAGLDAALILVTVSAGLADVDDSLVDAWLQLFIPGEEAGHGLSDVLFGHVSPSGRLPLTNYANEYLRVSGPTADFNMVSVSTGVGRTYRFADRIPANLIRHAFGFGLSYTTFLYTDLSVVRANASTVLVSFSVANTGTFSPAREVAQVYVHVPPVAGLATPTLQLRGFTVVTLTAGEAPTLVQVALPFPHAFMTTGVDGSSSVTGGSYGVSVSGHQPGDAAGAIQSNVVAATIAL